MSELIVTIDLDWACEAAIEQTLDFLDTQNIKPTIFTTHNSQIVEKAIKNIEVGLHPYFSKDSSHGVTISEVVKYVIDLPHNLAAFRCHRFASCNTSKQAMAEAGMVLSSNVCTDLEVVAPFKDRFGFLEVPIFMEDGGYLWCNHPLEMTLELENKISAKGNKVILIHPMHFALNTPNFTYMYDIKQSTSRNQWNKMTGKQLDQLRWQGRGIRDLIIDILKSSSKFSSLGALLTNHQKRIIFT